METNGNLLEIKVVKHMGAAALSESLASVWLYLTPICPLYYEA
jgi:hypothetical protein